MRRPEMPFGDEIVTKVNVKIHMLPAGIVGHDSLSITVFGLEKSLYLVARRLGPGGFTKCLLSLSRVCVVAVVYTAPWRL